MNSSAIFRGPMKTESASSSPREIPVKVAADAAFKNAMKNTPQDARIEHDKALGRVMTALIQDETELFKRFSDNPSFKKWLTDTIFTMTSEAPRE